MEASNPMPQKRNLRVFNLTPAGSRLAQYLQYVQYQPALDQNIAFGEIGYPPDEPQPEQPVSLDELYKMLDKASRELHDAARSKDDDRFYIARITIMNIRARIADIEGE